MNSVVLIGRLTQDPELRYVGDDSAVSTFTLAVDKFVNGEKQADFIRCKVWGKQAENLAEYQQKGSRVGVHGSIETGSYEDNDGNKRYTTEVRCDKVEYLDSKPTSENNDNSNNNKGNNKSNNKGNNKSNNSNRNNRNKWNSGEDITPIDDGVIPF